VKFPLGKIKQKTCLFVKFVVFDWLFFTDCIRRCYSFRTGAYLTKRLSQHRLSTRHA